MKTKSVKAKSGARNDEQRIRELDRLWGEAATGKRLDEVVALYAADATVLWPDTPPIKGTMAIRKAWQQMLSGIDGLELRFTPETIVVSSDGQVASDYGEVRMQQKTNPYTTTIQLAKYLVVWKKVNDTWKVYYDSYNLNAA